MGIFSRIRKRKQIKINTLDDVGKSLYRKNGVCNCVIIDESQNPAVWGYRPVPSEFIPTLSVPLQDGGYTHLLNFDGREFKSIPYIPAVELKGTPLDYSMADWWVGLKRIVKARSEVIEKIKIAIFVAFAAVELILLFLIGTLAMGG